MGRFLSRLPTLIWLQMCILLRQIICPGNCLLISRVKHIRSTFAQSHFVLWCTEKTSLSLVWFSSRLSIWFPVVQGRLEALKGTGDSGKFNHTEPYILSQLPLLKDPQVKSKSCPDHVERHIFFSTEACTRAQEILDPKNSKKFVLGASDSGKSHHKLLLFLAEMNEKAWAINYDKAWSNKKEMLLREVLLRPIGAPKKSWSCKIHTAKWFV